MQQICERSTAQEDKTTLPVVEWEGRVHDGTVLYYVDRANPTHLKIWTRLRGRSGWKEVWTTEPIKKTTA